MISSHIQSPYVWNKKNSHHLGIMHQILQSALMDSVTVVFAKTKIQKTLTGGVRDLIEITCSVCFHVRVLRNGIKYWQDLINVTTHTGTKHVYTTKNGILLKHLIDNEIDA